MNNQTNETLEACTQATYRRLILKGKIHDAGQLQKFSGVKPNLSEEDVQEAYRRLIQNNSISLIEDLHTFSGIKLNLPEEYMQASYEHLVLEGDIYYVNELWEISGIKPNIMREVAQKGLNKIIKKRSTKRDYDYLLDTGREVLLGKDLLGEPFEKFMIALYEKFFALKDTWRTVIHNNIRDFQQRSGVKVPEKLVQEEYIKLALGQNYSEAQELLTKLRVLQPKKIIQKTFETLIMQEQIDTAEQLQRKSSIKPELSAELVQKAYEPLMEKLVQSGSSAYEDLLEFSGIPPTEKIVQEAFEKLILKGWMSAAERIKAFMHENAGIELKASEESVHRGYTKLFNLGRVHIEEYAEQLRQITGVRPPEQIVQKAYKKFFQENRFYDAYLLSMFSGIKADLSNDFVQAKYRELLIKKEIREFDVYEAARLEVTSGIKPSEQIVQPAYMNLIAKGAIYLVQKIKEFHGVEPKLQKQDVIKGCEALVRTRTGFPKDDLEGLMSFAGIRLDQSEIMALVKKIR